MDYKDLGINFCGIDQISMYYDAEKCVLADFEWRPVNLAEMNAEMYFVPLKML
jgi:hypothetical protein